MILLLSAAAAACPDLAESLEAATSSLVAGGDAQSALAEAELRLACTEVDPELLARLWLVHAASRFLAGDTDGAEPFFAAASLASPTTFDERLGPDVRASWETAKLQGPGRLVVDRPVLVDGHKVHKFPHLADSGPHALQSTGMDWAKVVLVAPNEELTVSVPASAAPAGKSAAFLVVAGVSLAGAGGLAYGATLQSSVMDGAPDVAALEEAHGTQTALAWSALGLAAVAATSTTLHFVF